MKNLKKYDQFIFENLGDLTKKAIESLKDVVITNPDSLKGLPGFWLDHSESSEDGIEYWLLISPDGDHVANVTTEKGEVGDKVTEVDIK